MAEAPFGAQLYEAMRDLDVGVGWTLDYAGIQALKRADREAARRLLQPHFEPEVLATLERGTPRECAFAIAGLACRRVPRVDPRLPFGGQLIEAMCLRDLDARLDGLGRRKLEQLMEADRAGALQLLRSSLEYKEIQLLKHASADDFASTFCQTCCFEEDEVDPSLPFGGQLVALIEKREAGTSALRLDYAQLQQLRRADRREAQRLMAETFGPKLVAAMAEAPVQRWADLVVVLYPKWLESQRRGGYDL